MMVLESFSLTEIVFRSLLLLISIPYKLNLPHEADVEPQFALKISSLDVSHGPRTHSP